MYAILNNFIKYQIFNVFIVRIFLVFAVSLFVACENVEDNAVIRRSYLVDQGDTIRFYRLFCNQMDYNYYYGDACLTAQGAAILDNHLYRIYDYGICKVFRMDRIYASYVSEFKLKSFHKGNHANCAQIDKLTGYLYESEYFERRCNVEEINKDSSTFIQTIRIEETVKLGDSNLNIIKGDDGFLWAFGGPECGSGILYFFKFKLPSANIPEVTLSDNDLVDSWTDYNEIASQGGIIRNGRLYYLSGNAYSYKKLLIYDTLNKCLLRSIDLSDIIIEEPEDCDFLDDRLIITVYGSKAYYVLYLEKLIN